MKRSLLLLLTLPLGIAGCSGGPDGQTDAKLSPEAGQASAPALKGSAQGSQVVNEPPQGGIPQGGIVLQPRDPNDPKFKPDPKLAGGG